MSAHVFRNALHPGNGSQTMADHQQSLDGPTVDETPAPPKPKLTLRQQVADFERRLATIEARFAIMDGTASIGETYHELQQRFRSL